MDGRGKRANAGSKMKNIIQNITTSDTEDLYDMTSNFQDLSISKQTSKAVSPEHSYISEHDITPVAQSIDTQLFEFNEECTPVPLNHQSPIMEANQTGSMDYVTKSDFDTLVRTVNTLKEAISKINSIEGEKDGKSHIDNVELNTLKDKVSSLQNENTDLRNQIKSHLKIIEILSVGEKIDAPWQQVTSKDRKTKSSLSTDLETIPLQNKYSSLNNHEISDNKIDETCQENILTSKSEYNRHKNIPSSDSYLNQKINVNNAVFNKKSPNVVPGQTSFCDVVKNNGKNVLIIGDSIIKNIQKKRLNMKIKGSARVHSFPGATTEDLEYHIIPPLQKTNSDVAVLHVGTNDISQNVKPVEVADRIINLGKIIQKNGVRFVGISSITRRNKIHLQKKINEVNDLLLEKCSREGLIFIDNTFVSKEDLCSDGLHLSYSGTCKLANNFIQYLDILEELYDKKYLF